MAVTRSRSSGLFSGLVLMTVGALLLLRNYGHLDLNSFLSRWWPLLIIFWGVIKLYERTLGRRFGQGSGAITGTEVLVVVGMLALMGIVVAVDMTKERLPGLIEPSGDSHEYDVDVSPKTIPAKAPVTVRNVRGDITVRGSEEQQIEVSAKKNVRAWSDNEADRMAKPINVEISQNGDAYEVHPSGYDTGDQRISVDLDVTVPKRSALTVRTDKGDVMVSDFQNDVTVTDQVGDVEVRGTQGEVSVETRKGDVKVSDSTGDVRISGKGGEIEVTNVTGGLTVEGDFYGPVRADKVAKGVRMVTPRTDLTAAALAGHLEAGSGNLDLIDAPGNVSLRTRDTEVNVENPGGKVQLDNRNAQISLRFTTPPKDDVQITNASSGISLTLPGSSNFEIIADCHNCDIDSEFSGLNQSKTESGDSRLAGKYGTGKGPKITLKTSYGNIEIRRTSLAIPGPPKLPKIPGPGAPPNPPVPPETEE
jgi:DUF4097 and DUF4098 domain-containing protein YvlB